MNALRRERLARVIPLGERQLRQLDHEFVAHYHAERNHQGLITTLITPMNDKAAANSGCIARFKRLGGVLNFYHREAA